MAKRNNQRKRSRKTKPVIWVFCEGETEELYISFLNKKYDFKLTPILRKQKISQDIINRHLNYKGFDPKKDFVFLFYDLDDSTFNVTLHKINETLLGTNPCIEFWFLLHYGDYRSMISTYNCKNKEMLKCCPSYRPGQRFPSDLTEKLSNDVLEAVSRAKKLTAHKNPSSTVFKLIEKLQEIRTT